LRALHWLPRIQTDHHLQLTEVVSVPRGQAESNREWEHWGEVDPLYGVAVAKGRERDGKSPWTDEEFYSLGSTAWEEFEAHWRRYGLNPESCVEIGCGAGRLTMHLAKSFRTVHALDVSSGMIDYARQHIPAPHVTFHHTDGRVIPLAAASATAVFSTHVFQHFDRLADASAYFAEIARVLKPGGTLMIHLPVHRWPVMPALFDWIYHSRKALGQAIAAIRRWFLSHGLGRPLMRWLSYPTGYFFTTLPSVGLVDVEVWIFCPNRDSRDPHPFVLARRHG
jgi:SAM-dependent methyltransferase